MAHLRRKARSALGGDVSVKACLGKLPRSPLQYADDLRSRLRTETDIDNSDRGNESVIELAHLHPHSYFDTSGFGVLFSGRLLSKALPSRIGTASPGVRTSAGGLSGLITVGVTIKMRSVLLWLMFFDLKSSPR